MQFPTARNTGFVKYCLSCRQGTSGTLPMCGNCKPSAIVLNRKQALSRIANWISKQIPENGAGTDARTARIYSMAQSLLDELSR